MTERAQCGWIQCSEIGVIMSSHQCTKEVHDLKFCIYILRLSGMDSTITQSSSHQEGPSYNQPGKLGAFTSCWNTRITRTALQSRGLWNCKLMRRCVLFLVHTGDSACFKFLAVTHSSSFLPKKNWRHHALLLYSVHITVHVHIVATTLSYINTHTLV